MSQLGIGERYCLKTLANQVSRIQVFKTFFKSVSDILYMLKIMEIRVNYINLCNIQSLKEPNEIYFCALTAEMG